MLNRRINRTSLAATLRGAFYAIAITVALSCSLLCRAEAHHAEAPHIAPETGVYTLSQTVTLSAHPGSVIHYTIDGSAPSASSPIYTGPFQSSESVGTQTVRAVAFDHGVESGLSKVTYTLAPRMAKPLFSIREGHFAGVKEVSLRAPAPARAIYYTLDGSSPTTHSTLYNGQPITVHSRTTISAFVPAIPGYTQSLTEVQTYVVGPATPLISPASGTYPGSQTVTMADSTSGATIYYTTNGSTPTNASNVYTGPFTTPSTSTTETVRAIAVTGSEFSTAASATYSIAPPLVAPSFSLAAGTYSTPQVVSLSAPWPGKTIYYTTDGSIPTTSSNFWKGTPIQIIAGTWTLTAMVGPVTGYSESAIVAQTYNVTPAAPYISTPSGTYNTARSITISESSSNATVHYTIDGSTPTASSPVYAGSFLTASASTTETVRAVAIAKGISSTITSATYTITPPLPAPAMSPAAGGYLSTQNVVLTAPSPGQTIYYTTDGSVPTLSSAVYNGASIPVTSGRETIVAMVGPVAGYSQSAVTKQTYLIIPATPYISPVTGTYNTARTVAIVDKTPGTTIYYTTDGTAPTLSSPIYTGPFSTPGTATTETVRAFAVAGNVASSNTVATYTIAPLNVVPDPSITPVTGSYTTKPIITIADALPGATIAYTLDGTNPTTASPRYTHPFTFSTNQTGTTIVKAVGFMSGDVQSSVVESDITLSLPAGVIATGAVDPSTTLDTIPTNFLGYSHALGSVQAMMGESSLGVNNIYRTLLGTLSSAMNGPLVLRILNDTGGPVANADVEPLAELAQSSNVNFIMGVNLASDNLNLAEEQAQAYVSSLPAPTLAALEIGNEPDGYSGNGARSTTYTYADFFSEYQQWHQALSIVAPAVPVAGPVLGTGSWLQNAEADIADAALQASMVTQHKYLACYYPTNPLSPDLLLQPSSSTASIQYYLQPYAAIAHQVGSTFRMAEINSVCLGGQPGLSNSFSSALWSIDMMFEYAKAGIDGVNWNTNSNGGPYDLFWFRSYNNHYPGELNTYQLVTVNPLFYGLSLFTQAAGNTAQLLQSSTLTNANIKIWATKDSTGNAHLVIINKEQSTSGSVQITYPGYSTGSIVRLAANSYLATSGVTIGGQTYDHSSDGTLQGSPTNETTSSNGGVWTIPVNAMSAVLVNLQP